MRISVDPTDPGYDPIATVDENTKVLCDGKEVPLTHTADEENGIVYFWVRGNHARKLEHRHGKVEIILPKSEI